MPKKTLEAFIGEQRLANSLVHVFGSFAYLPQHHNGFVVPFYGHGLGDGIEYGLTLFGHPFADPPCSSLGRLTRHHWHHASTKLTEYF
eukprot:scaffold5935_cov29-Prasinocladus_malaysianus.AAC.2